MKGKSRYRVITTKNSYFWIIIKQADKEILGKKGTVYLILTQRSYDCETIRLFVFEQDSTTSNMTCKFVFSQILNEHLMLFVLFLLFGHLQIYRDFLLKLFLIGKTSFRYDILTIT